MGVVLFFLLALVGCAGGPAEAVVPANVTPLLNPAIDLPAGLDGWPALSDRHADVPSTYQLVSESDFLRLYIHVETTAIIVEDKRSGQLWRSSPADLEQNDEINNAWRKRIESPILLNHVDADRRQIKVSTVLDEGVEFSLTPVVGGVRVDYRFTKEQFSLAAIFTVQGDALHVTIPDESILEEGENGLVSVQVLAFFGAAHDGEPGYLFFPDGSGAIIRYTTPHPEEVQEISRVIYGNDAIVDDADAPFRQPVIVPVFGAVKGDAAFLGLITQGDFDAKVSVARSGKRVNYNHCGIEFLYRRQGLFSLSGGRPIQVFEPDRIGGDRQVRYYLLTAEDADYVGMASRYRTFLTEERGAQHVAENGPLMYLGFLMSVERKMWFLRDLIQMTTFDQTAAILDDLAAEGVDQFDVGLRGWNRGGDMARYPKRLPIETHLGGEQALQDLAREAGSRGQRVFLFDDYWQILPNGQGAIPRLDAVRATNGLPVGRPGGGYFINAQTALRKFAVRDIPKMVPWGISGLELNEFAALAVPDGNERYPLSRENFAATWMQIAQLTRDELGAVVMKGGNVYAALHVDLLNEVPLDSTHYDLVDETVPFYQIAVHGLVTYAGYPHNLLSDGQRMFLRQIEYGAVPYFMLTDANSSPLFRTHANWLVSSEYDFWRDEVIRQYRAMEQLAPQASQFIVDHTRLAADVYQTTYQDGTKVIVNYTQEPYVTDQASVGARDFVIVRGN